MTFDYRWYWKTSPIKRVGDDPDMNVAFRLNGEGEGYEIMWGFLGQVRINRISKDGRLNHIIGEGHQRRVKKNHLKFRIRAVGPVIKVKCWGAADPEPVNWTIEALDDWTGEEEAHPQSGAIAFGFTSRYFFDTTAYEYSDIAISPIPAEEAAKEIFFDPKTAAGKQNMPPKRIELPPKIISLKGSAALTGFTPDANLIVKATDEGLVLESKDGLPAFLWYGKPGSSRSKLLAIRAKGTGSARPLLARRITTNEKTDIGYYDPRWRADAAAIFWNSDRHTGNVRRAEWKPDTWFDITYWRGHWIAWQLEESDKPETGIRFRARPFLFNPRKSKETFGIGVAGKGTVTVQTLYRD
jgi:hypothetical protein